MPAPAKGSCPERDLGGLETVYVLPEVGDLQESDSLTEVVDESAQMAAEEHGERNRLTGKNRCSSLDSVTKNAPMITAPAKSESRVRGWSGCDQAR